LPVFRNGGAGILTYQSSFAPILLIYNGIPKKQSLECLLRPAWSGCDDLAYILDLSEIDLSGIDGDEAEKIAVSL
jgi:hypothetical protein